MAGQRAEAAAGRTGIREVAERAGVAVSSVSRVLSGHPDVSDGMRRRVMAAAEELGFVPDALARTMRTGASMSVGFVASDMRNALVAEIAHHAESALRERGYVVVMMSSLYDSELEAAHLRTLVQRRVDGVLAAVSNEGDPRVAELLERLPGPVVLVDREMPALGERSAVHFDHAAGLEVAVEHLVSLGHRHIGLVGGADVVRPSREREQALHRVVAWLPGVRATALAGNFSSEHGERATDALLDLADPPTALISGNNQILVGMLTALERRGVGVPGDVSIVACDDVPMARFVRPRIATVRRDVAAMGHQAAGLLLEALEGLPPRTVTLPTWFEPAESCAAPPAVPGPDARS